MFWCRIQAALTKKFGYALTVVIKMSSLCCNHQRYTDIS